ncbi:transposase [Terripilifer ovatus]|uniref:transposase n=1 Tax=Terripilifer ovatus TaxID=3032367 RepID=UPI003AB975C0
MVEPNAARVRRVEVITGASGRRRWTDDEKAQVVEETLRPDAVVSVIARRHGLTPQQLFTWRRTMRRKSTIDEGPGQIEGLPANYYEPSQQVPEVVVRSELWLLKSCPQIRIVTDKNPIRQPGGRFRRSRKGRTRIFRRFDNSFQNENQQTRSSWTRESLGSRRWQPIKYKSNIRATDSPWSRSRQCSRNSHDLP